MVKAVSTLLLTIIGPFALSLTMITLTAGVRPESVLSPQFTTTATTTTTSITVGLA